MNNSTPSPKPRITLKLKGAARKPSEESRKASDEIQAPPPIARPSNPPRSPVSQSRVSRPPGKPSLKPGAHWSDEYKRRMQADMDALMTK